MCGGILDSTETRCLVPWKALAAQQREVGSIAWCRHWGMSALAAWGNPLRSCTNVMARLLRPSGVSSLRLGRDRPEYSLDQGPQFVSGKLAVPALPAAATIW